MRTYHDPSAGMNARRRLLWLAFLTAFAGALYLIETALPRPLPFLRLGLANIPLLVLVATRNWRGAVVVALGKVALGGALSGMLFSPTTLLSLVGTTLALLVMWLASARRLGLTLAGVSVAGAVAHNMGQLGMVWLVLVHSTRIFYLTPLLILLGIGTGLATGWLAHAFLEESERHELARRTTSSSNGVS